MALIFIQRLVYEIRYCTCTRLGSTPSRWIFLSPHSLLMLERIASPIHPNITRQAVQDAAMGSIDAFAIAEMAGRTLFEATEGVSGVAENTQNSRKPDTPPVKKRQKSTSRSVAKLCRVFYNSRLCSRKLISRLEWLVHQNPGEKQIGKVWTKSCPMLRRACSITKQPKDQVIRTPKKNGERSLQTLLPYGDRKGP